MAGVQRNASLPLAAAHGGGADGTTAAVPGGGGGGGGGGGSRVPEQLTFAATSDPDDPDPADYIDDRVVTSSRWMDEEIAVGSIVAILLVAALVAVWISCRRRRRRDSPALEATETTAQHMRPSVYDLNETQKKVSSKPLSLQLGLKDGKEANGAANGTNGHSNGGSNGGVVPVATIVLPSRASTPSPLPDPTVQTPSPWEPYLLAAPGKHGKPMRARRRSVSLRSADGDDTASDDNNSVVSGTPSRGPSPSPSLSPDGEVTRKRSVTFNAMVEEVQILVR